MKTSIFMILALISLNLAAQTDNTKKSKVTSKTKTNASTVKKYLSRLGDPGCGDFCSVNLMDVKEKVVFYNDLNKNIKDLLIDNESGYYLNPKYSNTFFNIKTKLASGKDDNGRYSHEVITEISIPK